MGPFLDDIKVNGVSEDVLTWHSVMVDAPVNQLAIQRNPVPSLIFQNSNDAEDTPSKVS